MQCVCTSGAPEILDIQNDMQLAVSGLRCRASGALAVVEGQGLQRSCFEIFEEFGKYCMDEYRLAH